MSASSRAFSAASSLCQVRQEKRTSCLRRQGREHLGQCAFSSTALISVKRASILTQPRCVPSFLQVHVEDLARLYIQVMQFALANPDKTTPPSSSHGWDNLIYTGIDTFAWGSTISLVGDLLYARGEVKQPGARSIGDSEGDLYMFGTNSFLAVSNKTKQFGWTPKSKDLVDSIKDALAPKA